jgi:hypothetical protein
MPEPDQLRETVKVVARELRALHKALLGYVQSGYEQSHGAVGGPGQLLHLAMHDPAFNWLHALSELMVDIDELIDSKMVSKTDAAAVRSEVEDLLSTASDRGNDFSTRYVEALQHDTDLVVLHANVRKVVASLPETHPEHVEAVRAARPQWSVRRLRPRTEGPVH